MKHGICHQNVEAVRLLQFAQIAYESDAMAGLLQPLPALIQHFLRRVITN